MAGSSLLEDKKVLIVDDEPDILETLEELLSMCELVTTSSFEDAKILLETSDFDMAILDIMGVNGYKLLDIANEKKILAVMLTARALTPEDTVKSYKRGADLPSFPPRIECGINCSGNLGKLPLNPPLLDERVYRLRRLEFK